MVREPVTRIDVVDADACSTLFVYLKDGQRRVGGIVLQVSHWFTAEQLVALDGKDVVVVVIEHAEEVVVKAHRITLLIDGTTLCHQVHAGCTHRQREKYSFSCHSVLGIFIYFFFLLLASCFLLL